MAGEKNKPVKQAEKKEVAHEEFNLSGAAHEIINQAVQGASAPNSSPKDLTVDEKMTDKFKDLPMSELVGGPLMATVEAQRNLTDFYRKIAWNSDDSGKPKLDEKRLLTLQLNRLVEVDGEMMPVRQQIQVPFIGLIPIPSLLIDRVDVDFQMEVTDTNTEKTTDEK